MRTAAWSFVGVLLASGGCGGTRDANSSDAALPTTDTGGTGLPNESGYALYGEDLFPPSWRRVEARRCQLPEALQTTAFAASQSCWSDADCGDGYACVCGMMQGGPLLNECVPADCLSDADCDGACLLSYPLSVAYETTEPPRLTCERAGSLCFGGGDCPGNGRACIYIEARDRFECGPVPP